MRNVDNINKVIDFIRAETIGFDMKYWKCDTEKYEDITGMRMPEECCGTIACIGGTCEILMKMEGELGPLDTLSIMYDAKQRVMGAWLGVPYYLLDRLFYGLAAYWVNKDRSKAIRMLEFVRDTPDLTVDDLLEWVEARQYEERKALMIRQGIG